MDPGKSCIILGALAALVGVCMGVVFMLSDEFVVAEMQCNLTDPLTQSNSTICNSNNLVAINGEVCQLGRLGLFSSSFTPECLDATPFAINPLVDRELNIDPVEFGPLFPAQNDLGNLAPDLIGQSIPFTTCEEFFASVDTTNALTAAGASGFSLGIDDLSDIIFNIYQGTLVLSKSETDLLFAGVHTILLGAVSGNVELFGGGTLDDTQATDIPLMTTAIANMNATAQNPGTPSETVAQLEAGILLIGALVQAILGVGNSGLSTSGALQFAVGSGAAGTSGGVVTGVRRDFFGGVYGPFDSGLVCSLITGGVSTQCAYIEVLEGAVSGGLVTDAEQLADLISLIGLLSAAETGAFVSFNPGVPVDIGPGSAFRTTLLSLSRANSSLVESLQYDNMWDGLAAGLQEDSVIPDRFAGDTAVNATGQSAWAILCAFVNETNPDCSFLEAITVAADPAENPLELSAILLKDAADLAGLLGACAANGITTISACNSGAGLYNPGNTNIFLLGAEGAVIQGVLAQLYSVIDDATPGSRAAMIDLAIEECEKDEQDIAAISQAQVLTPAGFGLIGAGLLIAVANLIVCAGQPMSRWVGVASALIALIGLILVVVALLGVFNAPIYQSLGGSDVIDDGSQLFSTGIGFTYVLAALGGAAVGILLLLAGGFLLKPSDPAVDIMKA